MPIMAAEEAHGETYRRSKTLWKLKSLSLMSATGKTKCYVFDVNPTRKYYEPINCLHEDAVPTPRQHPYDLVDICSTLIREALRAETVDVGMGHGFRRCIYSL